ncbi:MAG: hypothetical protein KGM43_03675 [Planctomycetota bacterium]|nr:hypothetical protein [Planctomycetota bacterium]
MGDGFSILRSDVSMSFPGRSPGGRVPIDFTYRYDPNATAELFAAATPEEAMLALIHGNEQAVRWHDALERGAYLPGETPPVIVINDLDAKGLPKGEDGFPLQMPFCAVVGCSDARVPSELLFGQGFNSIFNIRTAGNVLSEENIGSLIYALRSFVQEREVAGKSRALRLIVSLGHRGCGGIGAAIRASFDGIHGTIDHTSIGSIMRHISTPVLEVAIEAFESVFGADSSSRPELRNVLADVATYLNAAWVGHLIQMQVDGEGKSVSSRVGVLYAVFDPDDFRVRPLPPRDQDARAASLFAAPPRDSASMRPLAIEICSRLKEHPHHV